jgi:hypothetical protein
MNLSLPKKAALLDVVVNTNVKFVKTANDPKIEPRTAKILIIE